MENKLFAMWKPLIDKYKDQNNIEIEIRFGRRSGKGFDTNVGEARFMKLFEALDAYTGWENKVQKKYDVYYFSDNKRVQFNEETDEREAIRKQRVLANDFCLEGTPFDIRLGISTEEPFEYDDESAEDQKSKIRWSFIRKNLSIDLTQIQGTPDDKDADEDVSYQVELEIINPKLILDDATLFNLLYKVFDILKCF
jgi:hypothetical protein